jgi:septal ring factor EnvC (AmiA/AmiB activator)
LPNVGDLDEIEKQFIGLKGKLPWPVDGGAVAARYGTKVHPVYKTRIDNPGIEIAIEPRSAVRAVHDGYVLSVQPITGFGDVVIVNHGRYKSVYGNLSEVSTYKSAPIKQGDIVGLSGDENSAKGQVVFFMIWEKGKNIDPETWIAKK